MASKKENIEAPADANTGVGRQTRQNFMELLKEAIAKDRAQFSATDDAQSKVNRLKIQLAEAEKELAAIPKETRRPEGLASNVDILIEATKERALKEIASEGALAGENDPE